MDGMVSLRCKYCGAPLDEDQVKADSPYVTCSSCGTTQQKMDAQAYLNQLMGQVRSWVSQAMPGGMSVTQSDNVMMVMPFSVNTSIKVAHTSTQAFEFGAKLNEIAPLAVSEATSGIMNEVTKLTDSYALLINNTALIREDKPGRYTLMANNFAMAAQDLSVLKDYAPAAKRFEGLTLLCNGCEKLLNTEIAGAYGLFQQGHSKLKEAAASIPGNMKVAIMGQAVNQEVKEAEVLIELAQYVNSMGGSKEVFDAVRKIFTYKYPATGNWAFMLNNHDRLAEVFTNMSECVKSKTNGGGIKITSGSGDVLIPFWHINLKYSFQTGSMWKKHSVEVDEPLLVPADFVTDGDCLNNPRYAVTDVFSVKGSNGLFAGLTGKETSISSSQGLDRLIDSASVNSPGGRQMAVPLSTRKEAERLAENYIQAVGRVEEKLKLSNPDVVELIYVPFTRDGNTLHAPTEFGSLVPRRIMNTDLDQLILL